MDCFNKDYNTQTNSEHAGKHTTKLKWHVYLVSAVFIHARSGCLPFFFILFVCILPLFFCVVRLPDWIGIWHSKATFLFTLLNNWNSSSFFFFFFPSKPHEESFLTQILEANLIVKVVKVQTLRLKCWRVGVCECICRGGGSRFIHCPMPLSLPADECKCSLPSSAYVRLTSL